MKELPIALVVALLFTGCAVSEKPSIMYVYRESQFRSRLEYLRFCFHYTMINTMELEGKGPCIDDDIGPPAHS